ncbi:MAG: energy coupling factor transporter S component ThiW [Ruminococcus sp.]
MKKTNVQKLSAAALLCAIVIVGSLFSFPVFGSKYAPVQHMVNIIFAVLLDSWYGVGVLSLVQALTDRKRKV